MAEVIVVGQDESLPEKLRVTEDGSRIEIDAREWTQWSWDAMAGRRLRAVLFDLRAPGAPGLELPPVSRLRSAYPELRAVIVMGSKLSCRQPFLRVLQGPALYLVGDPERAARLIQHLGRGTGALRRNSLLPADGGGRGLKVRCRRLMGPSAPTRRMPVFRHLVPALHDSTSGRLDATKISALFGVPLAAIARILGRDLSALHKTPHAESVQQGLALFERIAAALLPLAGSPEGLRIWLNAPNPDLEGKTPMALLKAEQGAIVAELLEDALTGQPG